MNFDIVSCLAHLRAIHGPTEITRRLSSRSHWFALRLVALFLGVTLCCSAAAAAATFTDDFDDGILDDNWLVLDPSLGYSGSNGQLILPNRQRVSPRVRVIGDFEITATVEVFESVLPAFDQYARITLNPSAIIGLHDYKLLDETTGRLVFFQDSQAAGSSSVSQRRVTLRLRRVAGTLFEEMDLGSGFSELNSSLFGTDPIEQIRLNYYDLFDSITTPQTQGAFDSFSIVADEIEFLPEPSSLTLTACALVSALLYRRRTRR